MDKCCFSFNGDLFDFSGGEEFIEVANYAALPVTGSTSVIYVTLDTNKLYRWTGSTYVELSGMTIDANPTDGSANAVSSNGVFDALALKQNIAPSVQAVVSSATVTPAFGNDLVVITAQAAGLTLANPTGTWVQGKDLVIRIKDNGTPRSIGYGAKYRAIGVTLPTTTVANKTTYLGIIYNLTDDTFDIIGVTTQA